MNKRSGAKKAKVQKGKIPTPVAKSLEQKALQLLESTRFRNGVRVFSGKTLDPDEFDFREVLPEEESAVVFWEFRREHESFYEGHIKPARGGETYSYRPAGGRGVDGLHWAMNNRFFPLPVSAIKRKKLWRFIGNPTSAPLKELNILEFMRIWNDPSLEIQKNIKQWGDADFAKVMLKGEALPILDQKNPSDRSLSLHCLVLDWSRGSKAIQREIEIWVKKMTHLSCVPRTMNRRRLSQLGAWRARRAGLSSQEYLEIRMKLFGYKSVSEMEEEHEIYEDPSTFRTAAKKADEFLKAMIE